MPIVLPSMARPTLTEPTYVTPPIWKPILAWAGLVLGGLTVVAAVGTLGSGLLESSAMALIGLAMALPGGWWIFCERKDRSHAEEDFLLDRHAALAAQSMSGYVSPDALGPLTWNTPLAPFTRRWPAIGSVSAVLLVVGAALMPATETAPVPASSPAAATSSVTTSTVTTTARAAAPATTVTRAPASPAETPVTPVAVEPEPAPEPTPEPAPAPAYAPPPAPAPAPVAQPVPQAAYYANCTAARAAGAAPIYRGQPGYAPKLDRDNDGIACE